MNMDSLSGKQVVIVGAARQGTALARYLVHQGARVVLNDRKPTAELKPALDSLSDIPETSLKWVLGSHPTEILDGVDLLCLSGGIPTSLPLVLEARRRGIPLSNDSQIFLDATPCKVIGITGSAGKTTTTTLVGRMAKAALGDDRVYVGGNIGNPLITMVDQIHADDLVVMELSSFQLEIMTRSTHIAAILNITPNHLDRHADFAEYQEIKARILDYQTGNGDSFSTCAVLNHEDPASWALKKRVRGQLFSFGIEEPPGDHPATYLRDEVIWLRRKTETMELLSCSMIGLRGEHNLRNVLAASVICVAAGLPLTAIRAGVVGFGGVSHRLELVRTWKGVCWYNDSIATAPERVLAAVKSFEEPMVLLVGGRDKNLPWGELASLICRRVDHLVIFGEGREKIRQALEKAVGNHRQSVQRPYTISECAGLYEAVQEAALVAEVGDVVVLSPGGTSFDEFRDFEDRGEAFRKWVIMLR